MTDAARATGKPGRDLAPTVVGIGSVVALFLVAEALIRAGVINRYIVPPPSEIAGASTASSPRNTCSAVFW